FAAIMDPVRDEVPGAVRAALAAGIDVKIVTGDVKATAIEIGRQCGLVLDGDDPDVISIDGSAFSLLSDQEAREAVKRVKIIWRARPLDKRKLVKTLQENGQVVAVTGDGTNDAPALNFANVGLAMGMSGTDVAKEAADIVLLDDSFASIVRAVKWGRSLYANIQRFILFQLTINLAALSVAFMGPFIGVSLPFTVIQMLWINLIMDTLAALALASEPPHDDVMSAKPRDPEAFILSPSMIKNISITGGAFAVLMIAWLIIIGSGGVTERELTIFFSSFVFLQFWNMFNARVFGRTVSAASGILENRAFLLIAAGIAVFQVIVVQYGGAFFRTVPLSSLDWLLIFVGTSVVLVAGEVLRGISRKKLTQ
ncbi:MAG: HAD family hydrolase, partial [Synergistales bacterium]|nr:HAD family hydrolase [Synergistales bacterium]